ncbi:hypothetical protein AURDEDRAFT_156337 [Auricularia subglabra TFB-10046 SS5]|nr:hypothetical protein AURDEDRAFT_156337 [Auricularia subglabra TFB-10046 SS5]
MPLHLTGHAREGSGQANRRVSVSVRARGAERSAALNVLQSDSKYRKYTQQVDKCLASLENVQEWADFIAFLTRLLKTFQANTQYKEVPRKLVVAKRLAQCLNPALPAGVHQRALDVYSYILAVQGTEGLQRDLQLWSTGLLPFFEYAATSVRPMLLNIYETYYLPLKAGLRPVTKAFILALMPGLEEETGEFFDKACSESMLCSGSLTLTPVFFMQNVWLVMLTTPAARGSAVNYLSRRIPKLDEEEDITTVIGRDVGLMIRAFSACLEDENLLVRRGALDLLVQSLKLSGAALKRVQNEDRAILMRAATNVVLRRDLSLNRRLYAWLLGPEESSEVQSKYLREHGLALLCATMKEEMFASRPDAFDSRPFKIFISLLDKWEIGQPLAETIVIDALRSLRRCATAVHNNEDVAMTSSTVTEAVEPLVMWKQLFSFIHGELLADPKMLEAIPMVRFVVSSMRTQDEEVDSFHLPLVFSALLELLITLVTADRARASSETTRGIVQLLLDIFPRIPASAWALSPTKYLKDRGLDAEGGPYLRACKLYGVAADERVRGRPAEDSTLVTAFEDLTSLSKLFASAILEGGAGGASARECLMQTMTLLLKLVRRLEKQTATHTIRWEPHEWMSVILSCLDKKTSFALIDRVVTLAVALSPSNVVQPKLAIDERTFVSKMVSLLFEYLAPDLAPYHVRSVHLVWALEQSTSRRHVEATIAQLLTTPEPRLAQRYYDAFGVLWRLTDDQYTPGFRLKIPMLLVLDTLSSDDPSLRRTGETWMRCCLRSYIRVLDPVLFDVLDPSIRRQLATVSIAGKDLSTFLYEVPFDQRRLNYFLETLLSLVRFGGQSFGRIARSTPLKRSTHPELAARAHNAGFNEASYLDVLVAVLLRFLASEPKESLAGPMGPPNVHLQATVLDLLEAIISRGEVDKRMLEAIEDALIDKLFAVVHHGHVELQNKLLHALHNVIFAESATDDRPARGLPEGEDGAPVDDTTPALARVLPPLLVRTILDALSLPQNRPVLQHWLDFVSMTTPYVQQPPAQLAVPLIECMCRQLRGLLADVERIATTRTARAGDVRSRTSDAEFITFLNALERLLLISLAKFSDVSLAEVDSAVPEKFSSEPSGGLLGLVSNVFGSDGASFTGNEEQLPGKLSGFWVIREAVQVLYSTWQTTSSHAIPAGSEEDSLSLTCSRTLSRCKRVLERLFRAQSLEVLEAAVEYWSRGSGEATLYEIIDFLTPSAQNVVHMTCESIACRAGPVDKNKKVPLNPNLSDKTLFLFLEEYMRRLEGPIVIQVWARCLSLAKDVTGNATAYKQQIFPVLRCITILAEKLATTTALEDRRMRKDLQEIYVKLVDLCVAQSGRSGDSRAWLPRATKESLASSGRSSPAPRNAAPDEKNTSVVSLNETTANGSQDPIDQINAFLAANVLPLLRRILLDADKIASLCTNIVYYIVNPAMKSKGRTLDVDDGILDILRAMSTIPAAAKAWRGPVADAFADPRFFNTLPQFSHRWRPLIRTLMESDRAAFAELVSKITSTPSTNIFTNREYEMSVRAQNFRRLSYVLYAGDKNTFLAQLPTVEEKVVDIVKNVSAPVVLREVYLCMRVLLCRLSAHNLASSWPVLVTEMLRIFEQAMSEPPADGSDDLQLILSVCKFVDLLLVLQTVEFQVHEWMFVTDTVDAVYRPDEWFPESLMDQLAEIVGDLPVPASNDLSEPATAVPSSFALSTDVEQNPGDDIPLSRNLRRPLLDDVRNITSIRELGPFFASVSIQAFEGVYASIGGANVDWDAVENGLLTELFAESAAA